MPGFGDSLSVQESPTTYNGFRLWMQAQLVVCVQQMIT